MVSRESLLKAAAFAGIGLVVAAVLWEDVPRLAQVLMVSAGLSLLFWRQFVIVYLPPLGPRRHSRHIYALVLPFSLACAILALELLERGLISGLASAWLYALAISALSGLYLVYFFIHMRSRGGRFAVVAGYLLAAIPAWAWVLLAGPAIDAVWHEVPLPSVLRGPGAQLALIAPAILLLGLGVRLGQRLTEGLPRRWDEVADEPRPAASRGQGGALVWAATTVMLAGWLIFRVATLAGLPAP